MFSKYLQSVCDMMSRKISGIFFRWVSEGVTGLLVACCGRESRSVSRVTENRFFFSFLFPFHRFRFLGWPHGGRWGGNAFPSSSLPSPLYHVHPTYAREHLRDMYVCRYLPCFALYRYIIVRSQGKFENISVVLESADTARLHRTPFFFPNGCLVSARDDRWTHAQGI